MSVHMPTMAGITGGMIGMFVLMSTLGESIIFGIVGGVIGFVVVITLYAYSPLPSHNGGFGAPPARLQKWGFTREPAKEYEEPTTQEIVSPAVPTGFRWATEKEDSKE